LIAISAAGVGKTYRRYDARRPRTLQEAVISGFRNMTSPPYFWSLRNVTFAIERGRVLGVIGRNGTGKSTLLRVLAGVMRPDEGTLVVRGRVGGLLELTAGFHPDLTGRENMFIGGVIRGLTHREVRERFESILDFAELHHVVDQPLRTYSSGMQMRLAFGVAIHCEPDILLVDEVLAVGDAAFQKKCLDRVADLRDGGCTIVMVSHDVALVEDICSEALWLHEGTVAALGDAKATVAEYRQSLARATTSRTSGRNGAVVTSQGMVLVPGTNRFGSLEVAIVDVRLSTCDGSASEMAYGDELSVELDYVISTPVDSPIFCITVVDSDGRSRMSTATDEQGIVIPEGSSRGHLSARLRYLDLDPGTYFIDVGVYEKHWTFAYDYHSRAYPLIVRHAKSVAGRSDLGATRSVWVHNSSEASKSGG
jgi:homopolymeric O-antigen transport system ATP-binding protein